MTLRWTFQRYRALNDKLQAALAALNHQYLVLVQDLAPVLPKNQGLLQRVSVLLDHPLDNETLQLRERISYAFVFMGKGFFSRTPVSLQLDILQYAERIKGLCLEFEQLRQKLRLLRKIINLLQHNKNLARQYFNLSLFDPENVWLNLLLQQRYQLLHQYLDRFQTHSWEAKLEACENWLKLLHSSFSDRKLQNLQQNLQQLKTLQSSTSAPVISPDALRQFDLCLNFAHSLSAEIIASLPDQIKTN